jgi:pimeloyl-ACP methyl ester carboxylesterase
MRRINTLAVSFMIALELVGCASGMQKLSAKGLRHISTPVVANGTLQRAPYRIDIPEHWNGSLVIFMHGYEPKGVSRSEPWPQNEATPIFLQRGYAVAASAYSSQGWAVAEAIPDSERLRQLFVSTYGQPRHTYVVGISLGGLDALATLEQFDKPYDGALSLCGVNVPAPQIFADGIVTPLVALEYFFPKAIPLAKAGLVDPTSPPMLDPDAIEAQFKTDEGKTATLVQRLQIPRAMLPGAMMLDYMVLREMQQRAGGHPVDNTKTNYSGFGDDVSFNRDVHRYAGLPAAMDYVKRNVELTGRIDKPVVLQSVAIDQTIPARFAARYPQLVRDAGRSKNLRTLPAVGEGHCNLTNEQIGKAFDVLINK